MKHVLKKISYGIFISLNFTTIIIHSMDTDTIDTNIKTRPMVTDPHPLFQQQERQLLLYVIKTKMSEKILKKNPLDRSCDKLFPNMKGDAHHYLGFNQDGNYLIEARSENLAHFVITKMATQESTCLPVSDVWESPVTCNNKHVIVGTSAINDINYLFKINIQRGKIINNFSEQMLNSHQKSSAYRYLAYNPCKKNFISVSENRSSGWLFCFHDSKTGKVKRHWREKVSVLDYDVSYSPDGCYCVVSNEKSISMRDGKTGKVLWQISLPEAKMIWHPQSSFFIAHSKEKNSIINAQTGTIEQEFFNPEVGLYSQHSLFTGDGNYFISLTKNVHTEEFLIRIRNGKTFAIINNILVSKISANTLSVSHDGKYLLYFDTIKHVKAANEDTVSVHYIILYNLEKNKEVTRRAVQNPIQYIRWRPHSHQFVSVEKGSTELHLWDIDSNSSSLIDAFSDVKNAEDWHIGLIADVCDGETDINKIDKETWNMLPASVQTLLNGLHA